MTRATGMKIVSMDRVGREDEARDNVCNICLKAFANKMCLRQHRWVHTNYKPFTCNMCGKGLKSKQAYLRHKELHKRPMSALRQKAEILAVFVEAVQNEEGMFLVIYLAFFLEF